MIRILVAFCDSSNLQKKSCQPFSPRLSTQESQRAPGRAAQNRSGVPWINVATHVSHQPIQPHTVLMQVFPCFDGRDEAEEVWVLCPFPAWCQLQAVHTVDDISQWGNDRT
jgi:hypothetical protein